MYSDTAALTARCAAVAAGGSGWGGKAWSSDVRHAVTRGWGGGGHRRAGDYGAAAAGASVPPHAGTVSAPLRVGVVAATVVRLAIPISAAAAPPPPPPLFTPFPPPLSAVDNMQHVPP